MSEIKGASVVIVGGGVTGLSAGWWLAREGVDVLVIEKGMIGWEASGRNGGGCSHHHSPLFLEEQRLWPQMDELLGYPTEFAGSRIRLASSEHQMALYGRALSNAQRQGFKSEILDTRQIKEFVPLAGENMVGGYFYHFGGHANPHRTLQAYAWAMQDHGGRVMQHCAVTGFQRAGGKVTGVETERGLIACDHLVIAAGPHTGRLSAMLGQEVPMASARCEMVVTEPLPLMPYGGVDGNGLYGRQTLRGNLAYGGGPHEWLDIAGNAAPAKPTTPLMGHIGRRLAELLPKAAHARIIRSWAGRDREHARRPAGDRPAGYARQCRRRDPVERRLRPLAGKRPCDPRPGDGWELQFADISSFRLARFAQLEPNWRELQGWQTLAAQEALAA
jgi:sarcosine oxidase subunit beta